MADSERTDGTLSRILEDVATLEKDAIVRYLELADEAETARLRGDGSAAPELHRRASDTRLRVIDAVVDQLRVQTGRFRYVDVLNREGAGFVIHVAETGHLNGLALKIHLHGHLPDREDFANVTRAIADTVGECSCPILLLGSHGPFFYFATEFVQGHSIRDCAGRLDLTPVERVLVVRKIAAVVDSLTQAGVACELKATRVVVDGFGEPHVLSEL